MNKTLFYATALWLCIGLQLAGQQKSEPAGIRPALLVIDIQNQFLPMVPQAEKDMALYMINAYIDYFRSYGFPIVRVYHTDPKYGPHPDSLAFQFPASVHIKNEDPMIVKNFGNGFKKTDLGKVLREMKCNTLFLCGLSSVGCVLATYFGARDEDFDVFMIRNAVMSHNSTYTTNIQEILNALDSEAIEVMLRNAEK